MDESALVTWAADLATTLGIEQVLDVDTVLDLAADAAHGVMRPAAPLTTFLVGLAIGQAAGDQVRTTQILETVHQAIAAWPPPQ